MTIAILTASGFAWWRAVVSLILLTSLQTTFFLYLTTAKYKPWAKLARAQRHGILVSPFFEAAAIAKKLISAS